MDKVADFIERWILKKLISDDDNVIVLRRNELAEELECAPSQISYVLSTRFTIDRGYIVESRRGSGGYVRIARVPVQAIVFEDAARQIGPDSPVEALGQTLRRLKKHGLLTERESSLISQFYDMMHDRVGPDDRTRILRRLLMILANKEE